MTCDEVRDQVRELRQQRGRMPDRSLKLRFHLDDTTLEGVTEERIKAERVAADEESTILVWTGDGGAPPAQTTPQSQNQTPANDTPHLANRIRAEQAAMELRGAADGERKTITALFADLKGSTALIEGLDPEEARAIIDPALQLMMDAVHRYDGYVAQALGDGIFALFGAPIAHEDHPQRALYVALRMQEEMRGYADTLREQGRPPLLMRVGLNTVPRAWGTLISLPHDATRMHAPVSTDQATAFFGSQAVPRFTVEPLWLSGAGPDRRPSLRARGWAQSWMAESESGPTAGRYCRQRLWGGGE